MNYKEAVKKMWPICEKRQIDPPDADNCDTESGLAVYTIDELMRWLAIQNGGVEVVFHLLDDGECYEIIVEIHNTSTNTFKYYSIENFNTDAGSTEAYQMLLIHIVELINRNILLKEEK